MKAVVAAFNQEKALVGAFSVITNLRMELFQALVTILTADLIWTNVSSSVKVMYSRDVQIKEKVATKTLFITNPIPDVEKIQSNCGIPKM